VVRQDKQPSTVMNEERSCKCVRTCACLCICVDEIERVEFSGFAQPRRRSVALLVYFIYLIVWHFFSVSLDFFGVFLVYVCVDIFPTNLKARNIFKRRKKPRPET
jgi:hypothetical protein